MRNTQGITLCTNALPGATPCSKYIHLSFTDFFIIFCFLSELHARIDDKFFPKQFKCSSGAEGGIKTDDGFVRGNGKVSPAKQMTITVWNPSTVGNIIVSDKWEGLCVFSIGVQESLVTVNPHGHSEM